MSGVANSARCSDNCTKWRGRIDQRLQPATDAHRVRDWLADDSPEQLRTELAAAVEARQQVQAQIRETQQLLSRHLEQIQASSRPPSSRQLLLQRGQLETRQAELERQLQTAELARMLLTQLRPRQRVRPSAALDRAMQYLQMIWSESRWQLRCPSPGDSIRVSRPGQGDQALGELSTVEQQEVCLGLQLALVRLAGPPGRAPAARVAGRVTPADDRRRRGIASLLCRLAGQGQQVLLVTDQSSVTDLFRDLGRPTLLVSRNATATRRPAALAPAVGGPPLGDSTA